MKRLNQYFISTPFRISNKSNTTFSSAQSNTSHTTQSCTGSSAYIHAHTSCTGHYTVSCSCHSKRTPTTVFLFCPSSPLRYPPAKCSNCVAFFRFLCPLSVSKGFQGIFYRPFIRNALNRPFPVRKGNQYSNRLPPQML